MPNPWLIIACIAFMAGSGYKGYRMGKAACEAAHSAAELERIAEFEAAKQKRIKAEQERDQLAIELEEANNEEPVTITQCLGPNRLRLINRVNQ